MKSLLKIYGKYIGSTWAVILLLIMVNIGVFVWILTDQMRINDPAFIKGIRSLEVMALEEDLRGELNLTLQGKEYLEENGFVFLMVLNDEGDMIYSWNLPEGFQTHYSASDIAAFTRWYLNDYPVKVWKADQGLLVAGREKSSAWKYTLEFPMNFMESIGKYVFIVLEVNLLIILLLIAFFGYRYYRSLLPLSEGIEALSDNQSIHLPEKGVTSQLAVQINQTSDILEQQREMLNKRDSARTEWIAGVSHDIRTPLSIIMGYADEMEQNEDLNEKDRNRAAVIKSQSIKIRQLIEDLNLTSKLEYHMQPIRMEAFYPAVLLRGLVAEIINEGLGEQYELNVDIYGRLEGVKISGDEKLIARAIQNLLNNSVRHNPGGCKIFVMGSREENSCIIQVRDDGCGIPKEVVEALDRENEGMRLSDEVAGQQMDQTQRKPHIMGLRIVKQIALAHKGSFQIKEEGHSVQLTLPIVLRSLTNQGM